MTRLTEWILQSGQGRRPRKGPRQKSQSGRALAFERYEERLALSTTLGDVVSARMADAGEGGLITVDVSNFHGITGAGVAHQNFIFSFYDGVGSGVATADLTGNMGFSSAWDPNFGIAQDHDFFDYTAYFSRFNGTSAAAPVVSDAVNFIIGAALPLTISADFTKGTGVYIVDSDSAWHIVNNSGGPTRGMLTGAAVSSAVLDSGWAGEHPDLAANIDLLGDVASTSPRVIPIPPPAPGADDPNGGRIAMTAFTGVTGLALARPEELGLLAKGRQPLRDPTVEEFLPPADSTPVETLRGRAVVYEVAQLDRSAAADREDQNGAWSFDETARESWWTAAHAAREASAPTGADVNTTPVYALGRRLHSIAARYVEQTIDKSSHLASAATIEDSAARSRDVAATSALSVAAERDAAFATLADDSAASDLEEAPVAAATDTRQRTAFGLALLLAIGAGPVSKLLRSRRDAAATEQRPPQRRAPVLQPIS